MNRFLKLFKKRNKIEHKTSMDNSRKIEREDLIEEAMAICKTKSRLLDVLDEKTRSRLRSVAKNNVFKLPEGK